MKAIKKLADLEAGTRCKYPVTELVHPEYNPRRITPEAMSGLKESIKRFGIVQEVVVNKRNAHVVGGNKRLDAAVLEGIKEVPIFVVDLNDVEEKALNIALNNQFIAGTFTEQLQALLNDIKGGIGDEDFIKLNLDALSIKEINFDEYADMPEYENEDLEAYRKIIINFKDEGAIKEFAELINQPITSKIRSLWFPKVEIDSVADIAYTDSTNIE